MNLFNMIALISLWRPRQSTREFDSSIIKKTFAGRINPVFFLSNFSFYYLVIFSDI